MELSNNILYKWVLQRSCIEYNFIGLNRLVGGASDTMHGSAAFIAIDVLQPLISQEEKCQTYSAFRLIADMPSKIFPSQFSLYCHNPNSA